MDPQKERHKITHIRDIVLRVTQLDRRPDIYIEPENDWYMEFAQELLAGKHGAPEPYLRLFNRIGTDSSHYEQN